MKRRSISLAMATNVFNTQCLEFIDSLELESKETQPDYAGEDCAD